MRCRYRIDLPYEVPEGERLVAEDRYNPKLQRRLLKANLHAEWDSNDGFLYTTFEMTTIRLKRDGTDSAHLPSTDGFSMKPTQVFSKEEIKEIFLYPMVQAIHEYLPPVYADAMANKFINLHLPKEDA